MRARRRAPLGHCCGARGLYSSHLVVWRRARGRGELAALAPKKRGRKPTPVEARDRRITELERQLAEMTGRAQRAEALVDAQKNASWARRPPCGMKTGYHDGAPSFGQRRQVLVLRVRKKISMGRGPTLRDESGLP
jgi:hypothetical protein